MATLDEIAIRQMSKVKEEEVALWQQVPRLADTQVDELRRLHAVQEGPWDKALAMLAVTDKAVRTKWLDTAPTLVLLAYRLYMLEKAVYRQMLKDILPQKPKETSAPMKRNSRARKARQ